MTPPLPLIAINNGYLQLVDKDYPFNQTNALGLIRKVVDNTSYFDRNGKCWNSEIIAKDFRPTMLTRLLAYTFYNPKLVVERIWTQGGSYVLNELKQQVHYCIDKDNDILTQFLESGHLKAKLEGCW